MNTPAIAWTVAKWSAAVGLACGVAYSVGGFFVDLATTGLNAGTALAFLALLGMPALFGAVGFASGAVGAFAVRTVGALARGEPR